MLDRICGTTVQLSNNDRVEASERISKVGISSGTWIYLTVIVEREEMRGLLYRILKMHPLDKDTAWQMRRTMSRKTGRKTNNNSNDSLERQSTETLRQSPCTDAWERVQRSRRKDRPVASEYMERLFTNFIEFHGDRAFGDDLAIIGGVADFHGIPVTVIAQEKGMTTKRKYCPEFRNALP